MQQQHTEQTVQYLLLQLLEIQIELQVMLLVSNNSFLTLQLLLIKINKGKVLHLEEMVLVFF
ncbi:MAG: hypothetical protein CBE16_10565 [Rhodospirillaceae bacterium TMED256]|nr:MAG: hypothetical protein CBE16_10565 [Rhodospirillaceae bacterium TMED256]